MVGTGREAHVFQPRAPPPTGATKNSAGRVLPRVLTSQGKLKIHSCVQILLNISSVFFICFVSPHENSTPRCPTKPVEGSSHLLPSSRRPQCTEQALRRGSTALSLRTTPYRLLQDACPSAAGRIDDPPPRPHWPLYFKTHCPMPDLLPTSDLARQEGKLVWSQAAPSRAQGTGQQPSEHLTEKNGVSSNPWEGAGSAHALRILQGSLLFHITWPSSNQETEGQLQCL